MENKEQKLQRKIIIALKVRLISAKLNKLNNTTELKKKSIN